MFKIVNMIRKYHNHKLQTNPWQREEEPDNNQETPGRQTKQSIFIHTSIVIMPLCVVRIFNSIITQKESLLYQKCLENVCLHAKSGIGISSFFWHISAFTTIIPISKMLL